MAQTARVTLHDDVLHRLSELLRWAVTRLPESTPTGDVWENVRECCRMTASCVEVSQRLHLTQCAAVIFEAEHWASGNRGDTARTISCTVSVVDGWDRLIKHKALHVQELYTAENAYVLATSCKSGSVLAANCRSRSVLERHLPVAGNKPSPHDGGQAWA